MFQFYCSFAALTAFFIDFDMQTMRFTLPENQTRMPDLVSPPYIQALSVLSRRDEIHFHNAQNLDPDWSYSAELTEIMAAFHNFHSNQGGSMAYLAKFGQMQSELISRFPKLCENLGHVSGLMASIARESSRVDERTGGYTFLEAEQCKNNIARAYQYFVTMSATLSTIIDKHVNYLTPDCVTNQIVALTEIYEICLGTDRIVPAQIIQEHRKAHPPIAAHSVPEAMAYYWRFSTYRRLIMSSQMQLRVLAATSMCTDLVNFWRRFNGRSDDASAFLKYLADFLLRTCLVAYILGPTCHPEITIESSNIVGFLLVSETYTNEHTDLMWQTVTSTQDPRISEALIRMTGRISNLYPYENLIYMCQKLSLVPIEAFGPTMREFCAQILVHLTTKVEDKPLDIHPYLLCVRLIRESSAFGSRSPVAYPDLLQFSTLKFKELLNCGPGPDGRRLIFMDCLRDIGLRSKTSLGSLSVLSLMLKPAHVRELQVLASEQDLPGLVVDEMEAAIPAARAAGFPAVISGVHNTARRDVIMFVVSHQSSSITKDLGHRLWNLLVGSDAACREDRDASWQILNTSFKRTQGDNPFVSTCFSEYLPTLPPECFCTGTLEFVRSFVLPIVNDVNSILLYDSEGSGQGGVEQLWRMVLTAPPRSIEQQAIHSLVNDVYVESRSIVSFPPYRARKVHLALADRCLRQLSSAATKLREFSDGTVSGDDLEPMVMVASEQQVQEQELLFVRSLAVLRELHRLHQAKRHFSVPDLSSLILEDASADIQGDAAELKYQAFDWDTQTDVKPLQIGKQNTVGSLLTSLREATGFNNFRVYYRGQQFLPRQTDVSRSLEDMGVLSGLMLVKREPDLPASPKPIRPGASPLENEILGHFAELWAYLSMEEKLAHEIYAFLVKLPPDENIIRAIATVDVPYIELFPYGQPFKSLYAVYALRQYLASHAERKSSPQFVAQWEAGRSDDESGTGEYPAALSRAMSLVVAGITDEAVIGQCASPDLQIKLGSALIQSFVDIVKDPFLPESASKLLDGPLLERLVIISSTPATIGVPGNWSDHLMLCLQGIFESCSKSTAFWRAFQHHEAARSLIRDSLLKNEVTAVRQHTALLISQKVTTTETEGASQSCQSFFWPLVCELIEPAMQQQHTSSELFDICHSMLRPLLLSRSEILDPATLFSRLSALLLSYTTYEDITRPDLVDVVASGLIRLMHCIVSFAESPIDDPKFPRRVFWKHMFPPMEETERPEIPRPILSTSSRVMLIQIIFKLVGSDSGLVQNLLNDLDALVPHPVNDGLSLPLDYRILLTLFPGDPYIYDLPTQFERLKAVRAPCGYAGLKNLSNTCYLNSLFTQLFMNVSFRKFMLSARVEDTDYSQSLLFQTQKLFAHMQDSLRRFVDPEECVSTIKTYEDGQIDIHNQMDVDEFYNLLFDRWESQLLTADTKKEFRSFYGGQLVQQVSSKECEHISERLEPFSAIQCDIKGKSCLQESLQAYVDGEIMEGDNKYKCSTCDRHVDAVKRACLKDIPDNLIFHLKRFDFNLRTLQRSKINDHFAFPTQLDMRPYTIEHLSNPSEDIGEDLFELVGVLVHSGTAESGHYYSYIRERPRGGGNEVWVEFNDDVVSSWDPVQLESSCFGGPDYRPPFDGNVIYDKTYSAYMLFYQRSSSLQQEQDMIIQNNLRVPVRVPVPSHMSRYIQTENISLLRRHCLYDPSQMIFVSTALSRLKEINPEKCSRNHKLEDTALDMALSHLDQVASRAKDVPDFDHLSQQIDLLGQTCPWCSHCIYEYFSQRHGALRSMIQRNPEASVRSSSANLIIRAVRQIKEHIPHWYGNVSEMEDDELLEREPVLHGMMRMFKTLFDYFHMSVRSWYEVFGFMVEFLKTGPDELATFLRYPFFKLLLYIIYADPSLDLPLQFTRMLSAVSRRLPTRPPSYENIIELIAMVMSVVSNERNERGELRIVDNAEHRLEVVGDISGPFSLTKMEWRILTPDWGRHSPTIFLEKLIEINQNHSATFSIVADYMRLGQFFEDKVYRTLKLAITGAIQNPPNGHLNTPFLRVAAQVYCPKARNTEFIHNLIAQVCEECQNVQNAEGRAFFEFQRDVFEEPRENSGESVDDIVISGLKNLPDWAPYLLAYFDSAVGRDVECFLTEKLFTPSSDTAVADNDEVRLAEARLKSARELGCRCLVLLKEQYVNERASVPSHLVGRFERVIKECSKYFNTEEQEDDRMTAEFFRLCRSRSYHSRELEHGHSTNIDPVVLEPLRRLAVDDMEEDGSGMFYSDSSSITSSVTAG
jgi:ubiquitin carboxyl-terminal hydrolase 34